jgi:hypothetical protein
MTKNQLDNIIGFCFNFHPQNGINLDSCSPDYLLEKWNKFIGAKPFDVEHLKLVYLKEDYKAFIKYRNGLCLPLGCTKKELSEVFDRMDWVNRWGEKGYNEVKEVIGIIQKLESKPLQVWKISELVDLFNDYIKLGDINEEKYNHSHNLLKREMEEWINITENKREYKLIVLEV